MSDKKRLGEWWGYIESKQLKAEDARKGAQLEQRAKLVAFRNGITSQHAARVVLFQAERYQELARAENHVKDAEDLLERLPKGDVPIEAHAVILALKKHVGLLSK